MHIAEIKTSSSAQNQVQMKQQPFFNKEGQDSFFSKSNKTNLSFFASPTIQTKCSSCEQGNEVIQLQEQTDTPSNEEASKSSKTSGKGTEGGPARASKCNTNPKFPNFGCAATALKLDIDENLWRNSHQFYRVASLYPDDNQRMWDTFLRYGLGKNLLETSFGFLGANETLATRLSYVTGIGLKAFTFSQTGELQLDIPLNLGGIKLNVQVDLISDPANLKNIKDVKTTVGPSWHF